MVVWYAQKRGVANRCVRAAKIVDVLQNLVKMVAAVMVVRIQQMHKSRSSPLAQNPACGSLKSSAGVIISVRRDCPQ